MATTTRERLAPDVFRLPVEKIREGYYSDAYFNYAKDLLEAEDRHPHVVMQVFQRDRSLLGGVDEAIGVSAGAQASWWGGRGMGTVPHGLIAAFGGDTVQAARRFAARSHREMNITVLVDFDNDSVTTALEVAEALGDRLWGVRLDTSGNLVDRALMDEMGDFDPRGVNAHLVEKVRAELDGAGHRQMRIVVSGGFEAG